MNWRKKLLYASKLYFILDIETVLKPALYIIKEILKTKTIDIIQLRDKISSKSEVLTLAIHLKKLLHKTDILFIINDYIDVLESVDADGIHLGQKDLPISLARKLLGKEKLIGISCHCLEEAKEAQNQGADYISIGPIFATPLKSHLKPLGTDILKKASKQISIPYFPVGGINLSNMEQILSIKINRIAFSRLLGRTKKIDVVINHLNKRFCS